MADTKISDFSSGAPALSTDLLVIARGGANYRLTPADLTTLLVSNTQTITANWTFTEKVCVGEFNANANRFSVVKPGDVGFEVDPDFVANTVQVFAYNRTTLAFKTISFLETPVIMPGAAAPQLTLGTSATTLGAVKLFGSTSGSATVQPAAIAGTTTVTLPNASSTLPIFGQQITFTGPTAARTITLPDAAFTVARTDAANTFAGLQVFSLGINTEELYTPSLFLEGATSGYVQFQTTTATAGAGLAYFKSNTTTYVPVFPAIVTVSGPTTDRTWTVADANVTLARTDAGQTFTGVQTMTAPVFNTSISTPSIITASGALGITPAAGSGVNINLSTTGDFAVNTNHLYVDTSAGFVGVGTTGPGQKLHLVDTSNQTTLRVEDSRTLAQGLGGVLYLAGRYGSGRAANAGIGVAVSAYKENATDENVAYAMTFATTPNPSGTLTERMRIDSAGLVGIGMTPARTLDVTGTFGATGATTLGSTLAVTGAVSIGNTVGAGVAVASTHKVTCVIGGTTYYLLASNV